MKNTSQVKAAISAVLIESSQGKISLVGATMDALHTVAAIELEHIVIDPV